MADDEPTISRGDYRDFLDDVRSVMENALDVATSAYPNEAQLNQFEGQAFGLYRRVASLFTSLVDLLANDHVEAAMIVARSFLTDCLTLRYFSSQPGLLQANVIRWVRESLRQELSLEREGDRIGVQRPDEDDLTSTKQELDRINELAKTVPGASRRVLDEKAMGKALGDDEAYWTIKLFSNMVHTTQMSIGRLMPIRDGRLLTEPFVSPVNVAFVTSHAVTGLFQATESLGKLFGWKLADDYMDHTSAIEDEIRRLRNVAGILQGIGEEVIPADSEKRETPPPK